LLVNRGIVIQLPAGAKDLRLFSKLSGVEVNHNQLPLGTGASFHRDQYDRKRDYDHFISIYCRGKEYVELNYHSPHIYVFMTSTGTTLLTESDDTKADH
jgi:hypothetical protein